MAFQNGQRFSIFDAMENAGVFRANSANAYAVSKDGASLYRGPVEYPKMLYFPQEIIIVPASAEVGPLAGQYSGMSLNEQRAMKDKIVNDREEEARALAEGWFQTPVEAIEALNEKLIEQGLPTKPVPPVSSAVQVKRLENSKAELEEQLAKAQAAVAKYEATEKARTDDSASTVPSNPYVGKAKSRDLV